MPNWCENRLRVFGPQADLEKFKQQAVGQAPWLSEQELLATQPSPLNFHSLLAVPLHVLATKDTNALEAWQLANWGTKWEANQAELMDESDTQLSYGFDTAWSPPVELLKRIGPDWPTLTFLLHYEEPGERFVGICKMEDATCEDHCLNL